MLTVPAQCERFTQMHRPGGDYALDIAADFGRIYPYLPEKVESIIDIGCGMAGIDVFLKRRYPDAKLYLLDGDGNVPRYNWNENCEPYNSRAATEALLEENGISHDAWLDVGTGSVLHADLIISLLSWGFHYPLSTYRVSGYCIADLRAGYEPPRGTVIDVGRKSSRCAFTC